MCSKEWVWQQYDHLIQSNTASGPGGDAAVIRIDGTQKALAACTDVTPRYVEADPLEGGKQAVAECWRNLTCVGAQPLAITDNLNFGNPERPDIMGTFVKAVDGIGAACRALDFPVVSGNVSLYNETNGKAILPTPAIGGVGLLKDISKRCSLDFKAEGHKILLIGGHGSHLGQSMYLREVHGIEKGAPPPVDLEQERLHGDFIRQMIHEGAITAAHDISDGGLVAALAEMCLASDKGAEIELSAGDGYIPLFAEDQARYVITCQPGKAVALIKQAKGQKIEAQTIGTVTGSGLTILGHATISLSMLKQAHESWLPAFMDG